MHLAHITENEKREQSLQKHSLHVAELCKDYGSALNSSFIMYLAGMLHDQGKAKSSFQSYLKNEGKYNKGDILHASTGAKFIYSHYYFSKEYQLLTQIISTIIYNHHSYLMDGIDMNGINSYLKKMNKDVSEYDEAVKNFEIEVLPNIKIDHYVQKANEELYSILSRMKKISKNFNQILFELGLLTRFYFSILIDSDCYDTACFYNNKSIEFKKNKTLLWKNKVNNLELYINNFLSKPNLSSISKARQNISNECKTAAIRKKGIYRLYIPTGGGKTISSMRYALHHAIHEGDIQHIIYVVPYLTILRQNSQNIKDILQCNNQELLEHFTNLVEADDIDDKKQLLMERWDAPIIITSMVQFLNTLFLGRKSSARRTHQLANSIIIFDEIQCLPEKCTYMFNSAINFLKEYCNSSIVLCSATQPRFQKMKYSIYFTEPIDIVNDYQNKFLQFKRVEVIDETLKAGYTDEATYNFIKEKIKGFENGLIILNTKLAAVHVYQKIHKWNETLDVNSKFHVFCLTTNECLNHRNDLLDKVNDKLVKHQRIICISTNLIEAGVDISFQLVVRDLAGLDSIAQAAGRCNRHGELPIGRVYIINNTEEYIKQLRSVYEGRNVSTMLLHQYKRQPDQYDNDILSLKMIEAYYENYYKLIEKELPYIVKKENTNLMELLSTNQKRLQKNEDNLCLPHAFHSAGKIFQVIEDDTIDVIVPYGMGSAIIEKLCAEHLTLEKAQYLLRQAQPYSISVRKYTSQGTIYYHEIKETGIYVLEEGCYDQDIGLTDLAYGSCFV